MPNSYDHFDKVTSVILDYTSEKETDYAILLDGDWGCGKTYFIDKTLKDSLEHDTGNTQNTKKNLLYISAAGIKDTTEFINDIYLTQASPVIDGKHKLSKMKLLLKYGSYVRDIADSKMPAPVISIITDIANDIRENKTDFSNTLIVIDDLERISDSIQIEDFLYRIYDTFISQNVKVLFVANESEINKNREENKYTKIKEKVIRHTIALHIFEETTNKKLDCKNRCKSFERIVDNIAQGKLGDTKYIKNHFIDEAFFMEHIENLKHLFNERKHFNLRTFITYLYLAKKILPSDERLKEYKDILIKLLNALCFALIELNGDKQKQFYDYFCNDKYELGKGQTYSFGENGIPEREKEYSEDEKKYCKYVNDINRIINITSLELHISNSLMNIFVKYIETGYLDAKQIIKDYEHILSNGKEYDRAYNTLINHSLRDGKDLEKAIGIIISKIKNNLEFFNAQNLAEIFNYLKIVDYLLSDEQKNIFKDIEHSIKDKILNFDNFDNENIHMGSFNLDLLLKDHELYDIIQKTIDEANKNIDLSSEARILAGINKSSRLEPLIFSMRKQDVNMICEPQFLEQIIIRPFAIALFSKLIDENSPLKNKMQALRNLNKHINGLPYNSYDIHLQKKIDKLKQKIKSREGFIVNDIH